MVATMAAPVAMASSNTFGSPSTFPAGSRTDGTADPESCRLIAERAVEVSAAADDDRELGAPREKKRYGIEEHVEPLLVHEPAHRENERLFRPEAERVSQAEARFS